MKSKIYRNLSLLGLALIASLVVTAQPGRHDDYDDRNDRNDRYDKRDGYDYNRRDNDRRNSVYVVRKKPRATYYTQPRRPSSMHVWVPGEWVYNRNGYRYQSGYWMVPQRGRYFVEGHWERARRGWYWVPGYWAAGRARW